jgi:non-ribosomal peptide synthetase component E (peptide arylation enzyme)
MPIRLCLARVPRARLQLDVGQAGVAIALSLLTACNGPRVVQEEPVLVTGDRVAAADSVIIAEAARAAERQALAAGRRDSLLLAAAAECTGDACAALARGEVALGMSAAQVMAATRTADAAWSVRRAGAAATMTPATLAHPPRDVVGELALVQLAGGRVSAITYRERQGLRTVTTPADATGAGRSRALADQLIQEGDDFNAAGERALALDRYDRALVLVQNDPMLNYKVATLLDLQLRPVEALMRYQKFLLSLELQRIDATGTANARLAEAIALAQQRVVVLQRGTR